MRDRFRELYSAGKICGGIFTIGQSEVVLDLPLMISTHLDILDGDSSDRVKRPYRLRLEKILKQLDK